MHGGQARAESAKEQTELPVVLRERAPADLDGLPVERERLVEAPLEVVDEAQRRMPR
jgi:hypothetical protein